MTPILKKIAQKKEIQKIQDLLGNLVSAVEADGETHFMAEMRPNEDISRPLRAIAHVLVCPAAELKPIGNYVRIPKAAAGKAFHSTRNKRRLERLEFLRQSLDGTAYSITMLYKKGGSHHLLAPDGYEVAVPGKDDVSRQIAAKLGCDPAMLTDGGSLNIFRFVRIPDSAAETSMKAAAQPALADRPHLVLRHKAADLHHA